MTIKKSWKEFKSTISLRSLQKRRTKYFREYFYGNAQSIEYIKLTKCVNSQVSSRTVGVYALNILHGGPRGVHTNAGIHYFGYSTPITFRRLVPSRGDTIFIVRNTNLMNIDGRKLMATYGSSFAYVHLHTYVRP